MQRLLKTKITKRNKDLQDEEDFNAKRIDRKAAISIFFWYFSYGFFFLILCSL